MVAHGCQCGERPCPVRMETMSNSWVLMIELQLHQNWGHFYSLLLWMCFTPPFSVLAYWRHFKKHLVSRNVESKANSWLMITGLPLGYLMDNQNPWETVWTNPPEALTSANDLSTTIAGTLGIAESAECDCLDGEVTFWQDSGYLWDSRSAYIIKNGWMTMTMHVFWAPLPFDLWENRQFQKISTILSYFIYVSGFFDFLCFILRLSKPRGSITSSNRMIFRALGPIRRGGFGEKRAAEGFTCDPCRHSRCPPFGSMLKRRMVQHSVQNFCSWGSSEHLALLNFKNCARYDMVTRTNWLEHVGTSQ